MNISYVLLEQNNGKRITKTSILIKKRPPSSESGRFHPIITKGYSFLFRVMTLLPFAVVEKIKVFSSSLLE